MGFPADTESGGAKWNHYLGKIEVEGTNPDRTTNSIHIYIVLSFTRMFAAM